MLNKEYTSLCEYNRDTKWDFRFLKLAKEVSTWSKDPSTQVGAVAVEQRNLVRGLGYNGFPSSMFDDHVLLANRNTKLLYTIHAEENCLFNSFGNPCTIYTFPFPPCSDCAIRIVQHGIKTVVSVDGWPERWNESIMNAFEIFRLNKVHRIIYRKEFIDG